MTAAMHALFAVGMPKSALVVWSVLITMLSIGIQIGVLRRYRRFVRKTEAELRRLEQKMGDYEQKVDAELVQMRAELDAYGAWSDANDRFFHHGLMAVSHILGARAMPARRACAIERRSTQGRRAMETAWRPVPIRSANSMASTRPPLRSRRRTCP